LSCFMNTRLFFSHLFIVCKPMIFCRFFHLHMCTFSYIYVDHEWSNSSYHLTFPLSRFCLER
jgi:hypothetical protein